MEDRGTDMKTDACTSPDNLSDSTLFISLRNSEQPFEAPSDDNDDNNNRIRNNNDNNVIGNVARIYLTARLM